MRLDVDLAVAETMEAVLDYWVTKDERLVVELAVGLDTLIYLIGRDPQHGRRVPGLPANYLRRRLATRLPGYWLYYRIDPERVLVYLLRHERQRPYASATLRRKAQESARKIDYVE